MANHKSAIKRVRSNNAKRARNRYYHKTARTYMKRFHAAADKKEGSTMLPILTAMLDKLAKKSIIHKNKASNLKGKLAKFITTLK
jgi:small subunit ribosomal protein S20